MPRIIVNGTMAPVRQPYHISYDPQHGQVIEVPWECAGNNLAGIAAAYEKARVAYDWKPNARKSTLVARPTGGQLGIPDRSVDEWQLLSNQLTERLSDHPRARALTPEERQDIKDGLREDPPTEPQDTGLEGDALILYDKLYAGEDTYAIDQTVLRHTTNVSDRYQGNVANLNVGRIYTTAQLLAECQNGNFWNYPLPGEIQQTIESLVADFIEDNGQQDGWTIGWRKLRSVRNTVAGNRVGINTEYWFGQHDTAFSYRLAIFE